MTYHVEMKKNYEIFETSNAVIKKPPIDEMI